MQLLLDAAQEVMEDRGLLEAKRLERLVVNGYASGDDVFKLWPTNLDQDAFRAAMTNSAVTPEGFEESLIVQAHDFFRLQIEQWIESAPDEEAGRLRAHGLETALLGLLEMVVIDLVTADDPFVIFETLNARGTPLLASDLVKNYVLQTATGRVPSVDELYEREWKPFEDRWWRTEVQQGRLVRPRLDVFLNYWLMMRTASEVSSNDVFPSFKSYVETNGASVEGVATDLRVIGETYRGLDDFDPYSRVGTFLYRWRTIEAGVTTPLLLWLFSQPDRALAAPRRERCLVAVESYLVRRMLCRMTTKNYNDVFIELLGRLASAGPGEADATLIAYLAEQGADARLWPNDHALESALLELPLYRLLTRGRLRLVLEGLEDDLRSNLAEESHVQQGTLTIEHVLPQKWHDHWPLADGSDLDATMHRERVLHSLGNLTLVNGRLNPALSNREWSTKRDLLAQHTVLHLNTVLLSTYGAGDWNETTIRSRGKELADRVKSVWPSPERLQPISP